MAVNIECIPDKDFYHPGEIINADTVIHIEKECVIHKLFQSLRGEEVFQTRDGKMIHEDNVLFESTSEKTVGKKYKSMSKIRIPLRGEIPVEYGSTFTVDDNGYSYSYKVYISLRVEYMRFGIPHSGIFKTNKHVEIKVRNMIRKCVLPGGDFCHAPFKVDIKTKLPVVKEKNKVCIVSIEPGSSFDLGRRVNIGLFLDQIYLKSIKVQYCQDVTFKTFVGGKMDKKLSTRIIDCNCITRGYRKSLRFTLDVPTDIVDKNYMDFFSNCISVKNYMRITPTYYSGMKLVSTSDYVF